VRLRSRSEPLNSFQKAPLWFWGSLAVVDFLNPGNSATLRFVGVLRAASSATPLPIPVLHPASGAGQSGMIVATTATKTTPGSQRWRNRRNRARNAVGRSGAGRDWEWMEGFRELGSGGQGAVFFTSALLSR